MQVSDVDHHAPLGKNDHSVITFNYHCYLDFSKAKSCYNYRRAGFDSIRNNLESSDWKESYIKEGKNKDPETLWCSLKSKLLELRNQHVPIRTFKAVTCLNNKDSFPIDKSIQQSIKEKHNLHRRWIRGTRRGDQSCRAAYTKSRDKVKRLIRQSKRRFEKGIAANVKFNPKEFWAYVRKKLNTKSGVSPLSENVKDQDSLKFDDKDKANILQKQFSSVFIKEQVGELPSITNKTDNRIQDCAVSVEMVRKEILSLNINKSCGPDEINRLMLIELVDFIASPLALLMNKTLECGSLPQDWKKAFVSPIYKKDARNVAENYRPISLTSVVCKLMEKFVKDAVLNHLIENNLLSTKQFGFVRGRSTFTQLLRYLDQCAEIITNGGIVDSVYFDFSKAFGTVPHRRLNKR